MTVSHQGITKKFTRQRRGNKRFEIISHLILAGGIDKEKLFGLIYADDPEGGPLAGSNYVEVIMSHLGGRYLIELGLEVRTWRVAGLTFYAVVPIGEAKNEKLFSRANPGPYLKQAGKTIGRAST